MKNGHGGPRPNSGPKPRAEIQQLRDVMDGAWSATSRKKAIGATARLAEQGDAQALRVLMSYAYGTPRSGDDFEIEDRVNKIVNDFYQLLAPHFGESKAREILSLIAGDTPVNGESQSPGRN